MELVRRNGDIKIDRSRWWLERGVGKKEERKKERHGGNGLGEGGMYGDFESCDSTIKLDEFCSWLVVVPATLCPFLPSHRSPPVIYYGSTALSHPLPPSICCTTGEKEEDRNLSHFLLPANFRREREGRFKYNAIIPRARKRMTESRMIHQSRAVSAELIRGRSVHGFSRFSNVSIETLTFHRSPERRIQLAIREDRSSVHRATSNTVLTEALRTSRSVPRRPEQDGGLSSKCRE